MAGRTINHYGAARVKRGFVFTSARTCGSLTAALAVFGGLALASENKDESANGAPSAAAEAPAAEASNATDPAALREDLNLLGQTATESGESRRNENVQFNAIDNNSIIELNRRLGTTATIVQEFKPASSMA